MSQAEGKMIIRKIHFWKAFKKDASIFSFLASFSCESPKAEVMDLCITELAPVSKSDHMSQIDGQHKS